MRLLRDIFVGMITIIIGFYLKKDDFESLLEFFFSNNIYLIGLAIIILIAFFRTNDKIKFSKNDFVNQLYQKLVKNKKINDFRKVIEHSNRMMSDLQVEDKDYFLQHDIIKQYTAGPLRGQNNFMLTSLGEELKKLDLINRK
jgi:hypothetical protein